jgi:hypothetical protein
MHHTLASAVGRLGGALHQNDRRAPTEGRCAAPEGFGRDLPLFLLAYRATSHDTTGLTPASLVFGRELRPTVWNTSRQGTIYNRSCCGLS